MGIESLLQQNVQNAGLAGNDRLARNAMFPQSQMDKTQYATPSQMPTSAETIRADYDTPTNAYTGLPQQRFASGGIAALRYDEGGEVDPSQWEMGSYNPNPADAEGNIPYFRDPSTGNLYTTNDENRQLIATGEALSNPDIKGLQLDYIDPTKAQELYDLKQADPKAYADRAMGVLSKEINTAYNTNANYDQLWRQFANLKEADPAAWYRHELGFLGHQQGWQVGQNTGERNAGLQPQVESTIAGAREAGLSDDEINSILGSSQQAGNIENQVRIANLASQGGPGTFTGAIPVLGMAALTALTAGAATPALAAAEGAAASTMPAWMAAAAKGAAIGAGMGGGSAALTGGNIGQGILRGGITGAVGGGIGNAMGGGYLGNMTGGALAGGTGAALRGGNVLQGAGMGAAGGALSTGISGLDAPDAVKQGLNYIGKPLVMSQIGSALSGGQGGIPGSSAGQGIPGSTGTGVSSAPYAAFNPGITAPVGFNQYAQTNANPFQSPFQNLAPAITLSKLSEFDGDNTYADGGLADGGIATLGSYSDGGRLLKGPGDGMSDDIPAKIGNAQPARLADGEFVIPADVVSHLGNGSTDAGAKQLYKMMDKIRHARTGNKKQGKQINPDKYLP